MIERLLAEILDDAYRYIPGLVPDRPSRVERDANLPRRAMAGAREHARDLTERTAAKLGFARRHFDPQLAAARLANLLAVQDELERTYSRLADDRSRRVMLELLKLRILGPYHARLAITPEAFRATQAGIDERFRLEPKTFEVSDPWFSPLSLYRVPVRGGSPVTLHGHSVDLAAVFVLEQYRYAGDSETVAVNPGDIVLDIGGCWGDTALYLAELAGPEGKVYTFEFDPESLQVLRANLALNPQLAARIEVVELALWDRAGESLPFIAAGRMTTLADGTVTDGPRVTTTTLDDFIVARGLDRVDFVKMDVEGAEPRVIAGGQAALRRFAPKLAIAAYHNEDDLIRLPAAIAALGPDYRLYLSTASPVEEETVLFAKSGSAA